jgi:SPP1 gp7 family putative phage head morphogenesis protein
MERLGRGIERAYREGWTAERLSAWITSNTRTAQSDATRIARDQIGKLNGQLARARQTEAGIRQYIWGPTSSASPRELHEEYRGRTFSWDDPPEDGHPGEAINCQCVAIPVVSASQTLADTPASD